MAWCSGAGRNWWEEGGAPAGSWSWSGVPLPSSSASHWQPQPWGHHGPKGNPQWAVMPDKILQVPIPIRVKDLPEGFMARWKQQAADANLKGFSVRHVRPSAYKEHSKDGLERVPNVLTLLGDRSLTSATAM